MSSKDNIDEIHLEAQAEDRAAANLGISKDEMKHMLEEADEAAEAERNMGFLASLKLYPKAVGWSVLLSTTIIMEGFDVILLGNLFAYPVFQKKFGELQPDGSYQLTAAWESGLSNGAVIGEMLGLFLNGIIAEKFGYRYTMIGALSLVAAFIFIIFFSESLIQLLIGEILVGIPWGVFQTLSTTYASEVCPIHLRPILSSYVNLSWVIGQLIASGILRAMLSRTDEWGYKIPFALQWVWPIPLIIGVWFAPESPWWLVRKGRIRDAKHALGRLTSRQSDVAFNTDNTVSMMVLTTEMEKAISETAHYPDCFKGTNLRRTEIICIVWAIQTLCQGNLMGYSTYFYKQAGMATANSFSMSLGQYGIGIVGTVLSWFSMNWAGRRTLYLGGQAALTILLLIIGCTSFAGKENVGAQWAIGSMLLVLTFIYDSTIGPVCYALVSELSSTRLKCKTIVLGRNLYNLTVIASNVITPHMLNPSSWNWGAKGAFFWAGSCFLCTIWTYFRLPEPKGRTYGELDILFEKKISARKFKKTKIESLDGQIREDTDSSSELDKKIERYASSTN